MNARKAKLIRSLAQAVTSVPGHQYEEVKGTSRIVTGEHMGQKRRVVTRTLRNVPGTFRANLKRYKKSTLEAAIADGLV